MTTPATPLAPVRFTDLDLDAIAGAKGRVAVFVTPDGKLDKPARRVNRLTKGALARMVEEGALKDMKEGEVKTLAWPGGLEAKALDVVCLERNADALTARKAGVALGKLKERDPVLVLASQLRRPADLAQGIVLRAYEFEARKSKPKTDEPGEVTVAVSDPDATRETAAPLLAVAEGVFMTRDLVSEPANHLTTTEFARRIKEMESLGLKVKILEEAEMEKLGMGCLLSVGQGSASPSKIAVMEWMGGTEGDAPLALVGKGVVFDTGGISLKPASGMEDMTMDMGGAGVVAGTMRALAKRKAKANVVGLVGLVENMPSGTATRPGDVVTSMKGDTVEVINTDAEGRLVLADVMWYAQETYKPSGMIDLATLTGAIIIGLGHEKAGVFSNDDPLCNKFLRAAEAEGEGAWRMPMGEAYDEMLKSEIADMKNVGGRPAGSITAAQFLQRFVKEGCPWIHLDIAGVASVKSDPPHGPKGASGWGVMALNRLVADQFEGD
ncbi:leucyl aminopeptidase [Roseovarius sp. SCSIO 43702]|uniref:leucyl aminopeptidase n=1 Tax=Roseovarius sp. SCSIO 43702 TaxID=2823043 RepID=UPI001C738288|nr:leucyl aminopeptidase [Roseovarius sp. SCSIO 43702]QYX55593.1 leucyl aminopeptidase [Roseovarius sp. SCSIO 43702]